MRVIDAQTWTLIAGYLAVTFAMSSLRLRTISGEVGALCSDDSNDLTAEIGTLGNDLTAEIGQIKDAMARLDRFDNIDRDVQILFNGEFGDGPDSA